MITKTIMVAAKRGDLKLTDSKVIDLGTAHKVLGGGPLAISTFPGRALPESVARRAKPLANHIITLDIPRLLDRVQKNIENHPLAKQYISFC